MNRPSPIFPLLIVLLAGCQPDRAVAPVPGDGAASLIAPGTPVRLDGVLQFVVLPDLSTPRHAEKFIRAAEGGFVELNGFRVDVPAGALPHDALVTIDLPTELFLAKRVLAEFGPHGIQFHEPVTLTFPLEGVLVPESHGIEVARWQDNTWVSLGGTVSADGKWLSSTTPHFSSYSGHVMAGG